MASSDSEDAFSLMDEDDVSAASSFAEDDDSFDDDDENVVVAKKSKPAKTAKQPSKKPAGAAKKKATAAASSKMILSPSSKANAYAATANDDNPMSAADKKKKTVEDKYQKKTQLEHILLRPDTYIGSIERLTAPMYVIQDKQIVQKEITFTPGLYKIFDEIVVNAADNKQRDPNMDRLEITVDAERNWITVKNNGEGIPIEFHKKEQMYVPTLIFGHLLTGSNFDDNEKKTTGGRNGYGAKLANVFSTQFVVECVDTKTKLKFQQVFRDNMSVAEQPVVEKASPKELKAGDFVQISFAPDLQKFRMDHLDDDTVALFSKRAYDIAGTMSGLGGGKRIQVWLNGEKLPIKSFKDYISCIASVEKPVAYASDNGRWEVAVAPSLDSVATQISFVNSIATYKGGAHVNYLTDQVAGHLVKALKKKNKGGGAEIKKALVVNHLAVFVNCLIQNPAFDSQTKDFLTTAKKSFGSTFELAPDFLKKVEKSEITKNILAYSSFRDRQALNRKGGTKKIKLTGIPKLDDANLAGSAKSKDCTLIITEGDSAKSLAVAGLSVVGRDHYGVFPLKGKPMNVRDENQKKAASNPEIQNLVNILGLKYNQVYDASNIKLLRYGHLMIMADQDVDGSHIKGLVINFIHTFWPSLLDVPGFLQQFITPIVKVSKGKNYSRTFFTVPEYEQWLESTGNSGRGYTIKYYKGLGTSTSAEAKEYFSNLDTHQITFSKLSKDIVEPNEDAMDFAPDVAESGSDLIDMVFRKDRVEDRKQWLLNCPKDIYLDYTEVTEDGLKYSEFINREYILFSKYDNDRSIPNLLDGFKTSQRKVLFGCLKRKLSKNEIKVAQLTGYIAEHSAYHHGEQSLQGTIVNMAQNYVGSNNINLLTPSGQFGTRRCGGKDAASARYIFTKLEPITRAIFHPDDDDLLTYLTDDGANIEPEFYIPVIPMVLVNGAEGIGTGWSSNVPNYSPRDVIANLRRKIAGEELEPMAPFFSGFVGEITPESKGKYTHAGIIERVNDTTLVITELPVKKWTQTYKEFLDAMLVGDAKKPAEIKDFKENHTETTVSFTITAEKASIDLWEKDKKGLLGKFKLTGSLSTSNMTLFSEEGRIVKYETPNDILDAFYVVRLEYYEKRKANLARNLEAEKKKLSNKARFVEEVCSGDLIVSNRKRKDILEDLQQRGYDLIGKDGKKSDKINSDDDEEEDNSSDVEDEPSTAELAKGYEYLLGMAIWSLTFEKAEQLREQLAEKTVELETLQATAPAQLWLTDLDAVETALEERDVATEKTEADERRAQKKNRTHQANKKNATKKAAAVRKKKANEWDSDLEESSEDEMDIDSDEDDDVFAVEKKPTAKKPVAKAASKKAAPAPKAAPKASAATKATKSQEAKRPPSPQKDSDDDDDSVVVESLMDRMKKKMVVSPKPEPKVAKKVDLCDLSGSDDSKKRPSPRMAGLEDSEDDADFLATDVKPKPVKAKRAPVAATKKKPTVDEFDFVDSDADVVVVAAKPKGKAKAATKKKPAARKKKAASFEDSDSEIDDNMMSSDDDDDDAPVVAAAASRAPRRAAAAKPAVYDFGSSDEEDSDLSFA